MRFKNTDSVITFDVVVDVHRINKKATAKDKKLAKWLRERSEKAIVAMLEHYGQKKAVEYKPNKYYLGDPR